MVLWIQSIWLTIPSCFYSLFVHKKSRRIKKNNSYGILIAARNEENVIGNLIDSLKNQNYPSELISIYVVADNCTDNTSSVAKEHGAIVYERYNTSKIGKGYALNFCLIKSKKKVQCRIPLLFLIPII